MPPKKKNVVALRFITDTQQNINFRPGDVITGWKKERVANAVRDGLARIEELVPARSVGPSETTDAGPSEAKKGDGDAKDPDKSPSPLERLKKGMSKKDSEGEGE